MFRQASQKLFPFLRGLVEPERQLLPEYSRQMPKARALVLNLIGIACVAGFGAVYGRLFATMPPDKLLLLLAPLAMLAVMVVWVLPDRDTAPTALMTKLLLAFFAVCVAWPDYMALQLPGLPWISFRRLFLAPMCLVLLVCVSTNAQFRKDMKETLSAEPILWKMLLAFVALQFLSIGLSQAIPQSFKNFINYQLAWTGVFFASVYVFRSANATDKFLKLFCAACVITGFVAIVESYYEQVLWKNYIPTFLQVDLETMRGTLESPRRDGLFRAKSVYGLPLPFAEIMALVTPVILYFIFTAKSAWKRVAFVVLDILNIYVLTLPQSRLGLIGFIVSHALFILIWAGRMWLRNRFSLVGPIVTLAYPVILIAVAGAVMSVGSLRERVMGGSETAYSDQARKIQKRKARAILLRNPVLGHGPRQAPGVLGFDAGGRVTLDNYFLWIALDYGMIGFFVYYGMFLLAIHRTFMIAVRGGGTDNNQALVVMTLLTAFVIIKTVLSEDDNHSLAFIALGMAVALTWREKIKSALPVPPTAQSGNRPAFAAR